MQSETKMFSLFFLPTATHWPEGTTPSEGGVLCARWAEPNYPSVINKPAATRPDASDNSMTEATSMAQYTVHHLESNETPHLVTKLWL